MIPTFLLNLFLAAVYMALTGQVRFFNFFIGFVIGYVLLTIYNLTSGRSSYPHAFRRLLRFGLYFGLTLIKANLQVAWEIITPGFRMTPRIIRYPVQGLTAAQITTLANAITLTPGTLTADIDEDAEFLYIHCMYAREREEAIAQIDELKRRLLREVFGP